MLRLFAASLLFLGTACGNMQSSSELMHQTSDIRPNGIPKIILFFAWPLSPLEGCINRQVFNQPPDRVPIGSLSGPVGLTRDTNGTIIPHIAQASITSGDPRNPVQMYKVQFLTKDPQGWRVSMIQNAIGVYAASLEPQVQVLNADGTLAFPVDISACLPKENP